MPAPFSMAGVGCRGRSHKATSSFKKKKADCAGSTHRTRSEHQGFTESTRTTICFVLCPVTVLGFSLKPVSGTGRGDRVPVYRMFLRSTVVIWPHTVSAVVSILMNPDTSPKDVTGNWAINAGCGGGFGKVHLGVLKHCSTKIWICWLQHLLFSSCMWPSSLCSYGKKLQLWLQVTGSVRELNNVNYTINYPAWYEMFLLHHIH